MLNEWTDLRAGDAFPQLSAVRALDRSLNTLPGEASDQYVALWYQQGEPVMGRVWNDNGKVAACFSWGGYEYRNNVGSLQVGFLFLFFYMQYLHAFFYLFLLKFSFLLDPQQ